MIKIQNESFYIGKPDQENNISATLRYLFLKDRNILREFLSILGLENICSGRPNIICEAPVPNSKKRIDIFIKFNDDWVVIENKVDAGYSIASDENQLITYKREIDLSAQDYEVNAHYILLCPERKKAGLSKEASNYGFQVITYEQFYNKIKDIDSPAQYKDLIVQTIEDTCRINKNIQDKGIYKYISSYIERNYYNICEIERGSGSGYYLKPLPSSDLKFSIFGKKDYQDENNMSRTKFEEADFIKIGVFIRGKEYRPTRKFLGGTLHSVFYFEDYSSIEDCCNNALSWFDKMFNQFSLDKELYINNNLPYENIRIYKNTEIGLFHDIKERCQLIVRTRSSKNYFQAQTYNTYKYSKNTWNIHYEIISSHNNYYLVFHDERNGAEDIYQKTPKIFNDYLIKNYGTSRFSEIEKCEEAFIDVIEYFDPILDNVGIDNLEWNSKNNNIKNKTSNNIKGENKTLRDYIDMYMNQIFEDELGLVVNTPDSKTTYYSQAYNLGEVKKYHYEIYGLDSFAKYGKYKNFSEADYLLPLVHYKGERRYKIENTLSYPIKVDKENPEQSAYKAVMALKKIYDEYDLELQEIN